MTINFVGNKKIFGIEFIPKLEYDYKKGHIKIWINNYAIGNPKEDDFYFTFIDLLEKLTTLPNQYSELEDKSDIEILKIMLDEKRVNDNYNYDAAIVHLGESFDDYIIRSLKTKENKIRIIVATINNRNGDHNDFNSVSVILDEKYLRKIVHDFITKLNVIQNGKISE